jgi:hypothetical protein
MDGDAPLTHTTLSRSLTILHRSLDEVLDKAAAVKATAREGFLMDTIFNVAVLAGWIEVPTAVNLDPEILHIIKPEFREQYSQNKTTVKLGAFEVTEQAHDEFVSLFWHKNPAWIAKTNADIHASVEAALSDPNFDPIDDLHKAIRQAVAKDQSTKSHTAELSAEPQPTKMNPALLLVEAKQTLGVGWEQFILMASKHLKALEDQQAKDRILVARTSGKITRDDILRRLLKGQNIRPIKVKAIANFLNAESVQCPLRAEGWRWNDFEWPKEPRRRGRPAKKRN